MNRHLRDTRGFTLVETLIVAGLISITAAGASQLMSVVQNGKRSLELGAERQNLGQRARVMLRNTANCTANLAGAHLRSEGDEITIYETRTSASDPSVVEVIYDSPLVGGPRKKQFQTVGNLEVLSVKLVPQAQLSSKTHLVHLVIHTRKTGRNLATENVDRIAVEVATNDAHTRVENCMGVDANGSDPSSLQKICWLAGGPEHTYYYDPKTNKCRSSYREFHENSPPGTHRVSCPAGSTIDQHGPCWWSFRQNGCVTPGDEASGCAEKIGGREASAVTMQTTDGGSVVEIPYFHIRKDGENSCHCQYNPNLYWLSNVGCSAKCISKGASSVVSPY